MLHQKNIYFLSSLIILGGCLGYIGLSSPLISGQTVTPIDGVCGTMSGQTLTGYDLYENDVDAYCSQGELDSLYFTVFSTTGEIRACKGINGGINRICSATTSSYTHTGTISSCGTAHGENFASTQNLIGQFYSNMNNRFLGNLCQDSQGNPVQPNIFSENALGRTRSCNTSSTGAYQTCAATRYFDARCGIAANTGNSTAPTANLCSPGYIASVVSFDNETHLRSWQCNGGGNGTPAQCTSWLNGTNSFSPMCNASLIQASGGTYPYYHLNNFVGTNGCIYGTLNSRSLSTTGIAAWTCINNNTISNTCGNIPLINTGNNMGDTCNTSITFNIGNGNGTFDSTSSLLNNNLCSNGGYVSSFSNLSDRWRRKCGVQNCEAMKSTQFMCGWATQQPRSSHPTNGICDEGIASTIKMSNTERGWICTTNTTNIQTFNNSSCTNMSCVLNVLDFYNGRTAICRAPRITNGQCKWQTQIDPTGYALPDDVLQAGMCESGIPDPLIPTQDTLNNKWSWICKSTTARGQDSSACYAKVKLPQVTINYIPNITSNSITSVTAFATGFNPLYVTFDTPVNQWYRLFTQNGYFIFRYHDRAGNTGQALAVVENIQNNLPTATVISTPSIPTSGNVVISLTGFNRPYVPIVTFTGACLNSNSCTQNSSIHPYLFTVTFSGNATGEFILTDQTGLTGRVPVTVNNIDRIAPTGNIHYNITSATRNNVTANIANTSEPIIITNNNGQSGYVFTENGSFDFQIRDLAGNTGTITATVTRISKTAPSATVVYSRTTTGDTNVIATLTDFTNSGTTILNNSGRISYNFTHNGEFTFLLQDAAGNTGAVLATVENIDKPIVQGLLSGYTNLLCDQRTPAPADTRSQEYNYHIYTAINNCIMKTIKGKNGHRYFYPSRKISRGEFITAVGRMIRLTTSYSGSIVNSLSSDYMQALFIGGDSNSIINEADVWGLLAATPVTQKNKKRQVDLSKPISATEANTIFWQALRIIGNSTDTRYLIKGKGNLTKAQAAYAIGSILSQYEGVALGNHHVFMQELSKKLVGSTPQSRRVTISKLIQKINKTPRTSLYRLGIEPTILIQDLRAIALGDDVERRPLQIIDIETSLDGLLRLYTPSRLPANNTNQTYQSNFFNFWSTF